MNLSEHRRDYAAYFSAVELEKFRRHAGHTRDLDLRPAEDRYADLWTPERLAGLRRAFDETPAGYEAERAALRALVGACALKQVELRAHDVTEELRRCEAAARFTWGGGVVPAAEAPPLLAAETDPARRRELAARRLGALSACDDLRAARFASLGEAARALGFDGRVSLYQSFTGIGLDELSAGALLFLERTERAYSSGLAEWAAREAAPHTNGGLHSADSFRFRRAATFDPYFRPTDFGAAYADTLAGLGVRAEAQKNLRVDAGPRAGKAARTACFPVGPPADVRLVLGSEAGGADFYRRSFVEAGRAQMFAWVSSDMAARRPEFVRAPDAATEWGHGSLLSGLLSDSAWLASFVRARADGLRAAARGLALVELHDARRDCAVLGHARALDRAAGAASDSLAESYSESLTRATGFCHDAGAQLLDADEWFASATRLRARMFAAGFGEHLRSRHGRRWFASRAAGDELIDVWNTASRHGPEELSRLVWGAGLSFELLADTLTGASGGARG